jgi:2-polyprenyl-3-methyl-5-hydroxy-6-metoxy-1,4-benzoquinol methylase
MKELMDTSVWKKAWKEDPFTAVNRMRKAGIDPVHAFDKKAESFNKEVFSEEGRHRARRIISWLEDQGVVLNGAAILDIGAASGGFTVPFAREGAQVTALEPSLPLVRLLEENVAELTAADTVDIVAEPFEDIDLDAKGWEKAFDLVFVSMCPVLTDWEAVERVLSCARQFCYMSTMVGAPEHSLLDELWPLVTDRPGKPGNMEMAYLTQLLLLKGYAFQSLVTRELKTTVLTHSAAFDEAISMLKVSGIDADERVRSIVADHLARNYPGGEVTIRQGGRFGKVLVRLQSQHMYSRGEGQ